MAAIINIANTEMPMVSKSKSSCHRAAATTSQSGGTSGFPNREIPDCSLCCDHRSVVAWRGKSSEVRDCPWCIRDAAHRTEEFIAYLERGRRS